MKKVLITSILILAIISSLLAGTVSYYTTTIDVAAGSVTAKEFIFASEHKENSFTKDTKIAPGETVNWSFQVMNYEDELVTETDLYYKLTFTLGAVNGKQAIEPVEVNIRDSKGGSILATATHSQAKDITGKFLVAEKGQAKDYFVEVVWPHGENDSTYAGSNYGSSITVSAIASQVPFDLETKPIEPEEPGEPGEDEGGEGEMPNYAENIQITYLTLKENLHWNKHKYEVIIKNSGNEPIVDWQLDFKLPADQDGSWEAELTSGEGDLKIYTPPMNYNQTINPGQEISFGGIWMIGTPIQPTEIKFNGSPVRGSDFTYLPGALDS